MIKKFLLTTLFAASLLQIGNTSLFAQNRVLINKTKIAHETYPSKAFNFFTQSETKDPLIEKIIQNATYLTLNTSELNALNTNPNQTIVFTLPINGKMTNVYLDKRDIYNVDFNAWVLNTSQKYDVDAQYTKGNFYRGYIDGKEVSLAAFSFYENEIGAIFSIEGQGNYNLVLNYENPGVNRDNYILFKESDIIDGDKHRKGCESVLVPDQVNINDNGLKAKTTASKSCKTISIALYGDYLLFERRSYSLTGTQNYLTTVFNGNATLFENDEIYVSLKNLYVSIVNDNYPTSSSNAVLNKFGNDINTNVTADLMQMVIGYVNNQNWSPLGGLAWLDVLCLTPYQSVNQGTYIGPFSMVNTEGPAAAASFPVYSWDVSASTHEFGHNLGSPHTHDCAWNGTNTRIDGCGPNSGNPGNGSCASGVIPTKGTIMSYCHLLQNVGVDFNLGFGAQPKALILNRVGQSNCMTSTNLPNAILNAGNNVVTSNKYCVDGNWAHFYFDYNDANPANDVLILSINNSAIPTMDLSTIKVTTTTNSSYGSNSAFAANYPYATFNDWHEFNRKWNVNVPTPFTGNTKVRFPFNSTDENDMKGSFSTLTNLNQLKAFVYKTSAAAQNPSIANNSQVETYNYITNGTPGSWVLNNTNPNFYSAEITINGEFHGGSLGFGTDAKPNSISNLNSVKNLSIYPNPAEQSINISLENIDVKNATIQVIDNLGRIIQTKELSKNTDVLTLDISNIATGYYSIKLVSAGGLHIANFIKK